MEQFIFGRTGEPNIYASMIIKNRTPLRQDMIEIDVDRVMETLGVERDEANEVVKAVVDSIFRMRTIEL